MTSRVLTLTKVLIANRGEIAIRIATAARELGLATVAVFSEADARLPHVRACDEAVPIGPPAPGESYLRIDKLIAAAKATGADCVHPGYGFLAENADFAQAVTDAGLTWVGPPADVIRKMGDKLDSKATAASYDVPMLTGMPVSPDRPEDLDKAAEVVGFPLIIKPSAGGGGKGIYVCRDMDQLRSNIKLAVSNAERAFGDGTCFVERYLTNPRHIEVQVIGDTHGNVVHLGERECSIQRRNQKLVEESPSPFCDDQMRAAIHKAGADAARAAGYSSAGTVEFLVDSASREFFFCEMNTRIQVEHPVTECVTGRDIVKEMFRVAAGQPLSFTQDDVRFSGHAIEYRIIAEDPFANFMPSLGKIDAIHAPHGPGIRLDIGFAPGDEVTMHYDSLLAKLIVHADTRDEAIERTRAALDSFHIVGPTTCLPFHRALLDDADFRSGEFSIHWCERRMADGFPPQPALELDDVAALATALKVAGAGQTGRAKVSGTPGTSRDASGCHAEGWGWRMAGRAEFGRRF
jgi:acetyl-CoA carboxylase biotin carboxylase subunit